MVGEFLPPVAKNVVILSSLPLSTLMAVFVPLPPPPPPSPPAKQHPGEVSFAAPPFLTECSCEAAAKKPCSVVWAPPQKNERNWRWIVRVGPKGVSQRRGEEGTIFGNGSKQKIQWIAASKHRYVGCGNKIESFFPFHGPVQKGKKGSSYLSPPGSFLPTFVSSCISCTLPNSLLP